MFIPFPYLSRLHVYPVSMFIPSSCLSHLHCVYPISMFIPSSCLSRPHVYPVPMFTPCLCLSCPHVHFIPHVHPMPTFTPCPCIFILSPCSPHADVHSIPMPMFILSPYSPHSLCLSSLHVHLIPMFIPPHLHVPFFFMFILCSYPSHLHVHSIPILMLVMITGTRHMWTLTHANQVLHTNGPYSTYICLFLYYYFFSLS
jgi:hypothetical protein